MNNSEIIKGKSVKKYLDRVLKNGYNDACTNGTMRTTNVITRNDELYKFIMED